jgi:hypothetical protein
MKKNENSSNENRGQTIFLENFEVAELATEEIKWLFPTRITMKF